MIRTVGIVSLSRGLLGEPFMQHEAALGLSRLQAYGLRVKFLPHACDGLDALQRHPEWRAEDLLQAFRDPEIDLILCAIGGDDTYRLAPYLFEHGELQKAVRQKPFLGFSDTTIDHFMLHRIGLPTFYGQAFLPDVCELDREMLPYTRQYFEELLMTGRIRCIRPSGVWYESRKSYDASQLGIPLRAHEEAGGFRLLQGGGQFRGEILGGCIDSIFDMFDPARYADMPAICRKYGLFPSEAEWQGKILLLETSEEQMEPAKFRRALEYLKQAGVFAAVSGVLVGKPMDGVWQAEYEALLPQVIADPELPVVCGVPVGHALPRCIVPFGVMAQVDVPAQKIEFL